MGKKTVYRTEKAAEIKGAIKALRAEMKAEEERCNDVFRKYCDMEGKYGHYAVSPWDCGQGFRGYHYEYDSAELERKEKEEREQFLKDNNYRNSLEIHSEYFDRLIELENAFNLEQYGMTTEEKDLRDAIVNRKKDLKEAEENLEKAKKRIEYCKDEIIEAEKKLANYLEKKES